MKTLAPTGRQMLMILGIFAGLVLLFTAVSVRLAPPSVDVGGARPVETIPPHLLELGGFGALLGVAALWVYGRGGVWVALLLPAMVVLLDLDHLPVFLGIAQPIRPAHSVVFLAADLTITTIILRRFDFNLIVVSAFLGHMGVDAGLFPPFSPFSFDYYQLDQYRLPLIVGSALLALAAGFLWRRLHISTLKG